MLARNFDRQAAALLITKLITMPLATMILAGGPGECYAPKPLFGFKPTISKTKYNLSESAWALTGFHGGTGGGVILGLAFDPLYLEYEYHYSYTVQGKNICVAVDKMKMYYRARPIVFISEEFPRGSCEFNAVVKHENRHVQTLKKVHKKTAPALKEFVYDTLLQVKPVKVKSELGIAAAEQKIEKDIRTKLDAYMVDIQNELSHEQIKVDAPSEYQSVSDKCDDWAGRLRAD